MSLGLVCHWLDDNEQNALKASELRLGRFRAGLYTEQHARATYLANIERHVSFMPTIAAAGIRVFRLTSSLMTLADQVPRTWWDNDENRDALARLGAICTTAGMRITMHPGQFVVISSDDERVVENSVRELEAHAWILDMMGMPRTPYSALNIHGGKGDRAENLVEVIKQLPETVASRLTLENDESSYSVSDLLRVHLETGVPVVFDTHHHSFNTDGVDYDLAHNATVATWRASGVKPLQHISNTQPGLENGSFSDRRKHSDYIHTVPEPQLRALLRDEVDVEVECKMKNRGVFKMASDFNIPL